jgi:hypothetical protein
MDRLDPLRPPTPSPARAELDRLGDEIAALSAHLDAATAHLLALIREFDARGGWGQGCRSCAHWLTWRTGLDPGAARERVRVARALGTLPKLAGALARGVLSYSKVRALTRVATGETEARLLEVAQCGTAAHVETIVRALRRVDRQEEAKEAAVRHAGRTLQVYPDEDGMVVVRGRLEPEVGAVLLRALEAAREVLYAKRQAAGELPGLERPTPGQQQADALGLGGGDGAGEGARGGAGERAVPGGGPRGRRGAGRPRPARAVALGGWRERFRGNVAAAGLRRHLGRFP